MENERRADVLVAGLGGAGASALYHCARRGLRVVGIDRFEPGHDRGSSHGETRVIRQAYFEHPDYVPLLRRAYTLWEALETEAEASLFHRCGLFMAGPPDGEIIGGSRLAAERYDVLLETVEASDLAERFPSFRIPEDSVAAWEPSGGYLEVEACVRAYARLAERHGATIRSGETILSFDAGAFGVRVETDRGTYEAERLILAPGAWAVRLLPSISPRVNLHVLRKVLAWYPRRDVARPAPESTFFFERPYGAYYGFPSLDGKTVKLAEHTGGGTVDDPLALDRGLHDTDFQGPARFVDEVMPSLSPTPARHAVCMYTMTDDAHFVVDRHPEHEAVVLAAGFSGHGFKFMSAIGAVLAELAIDGASTSPIDFLGLDRFPA